MHQRALDYFLKAFAEFTYFAFTRKEVAAFSELFSILFTIILNLPIVGIVSRAFYLK